MALEAEECCYCNIRTRAEAEAEAEAAAVNTCIHQAEVGQTVQDTKTVQGILVLVRGMMNTTDNWTVLAQDNSTARDSLIAPGTGSSEVMAEVLDTYMTAGTDLEVVPGQGTYPLRGISLEEAGVQVLGSTTVPWQKGMIREGTEAYMNQENEV